MKQLDKLQNIMVVGFIILGLLLITLGVWNQVIPQASPRQTSNQKQVASRWPAVINMGSGGTMTMNGKTINMGPATPIATYQAPQNAEHVDTFTLTAEAARINLGQGAVVNAYTFNGTAPGPTLHVRQGDLVVAHLVNHLSFGVTIHWHGIDVPNSQDGVAGLTQNAVKPGQTFTYRFIAKDSGTYWYHSHQESYDETTHGLYGNIIVDPVKPTVHDDVDATVDLHGWSTANSVPLTINGTDEISHIAAQPGQWVRLRITNTDFLTHTLALSGAPFTVAALDGHDINAPQLLTSTMVTIGAAQRYDLRFQMPAQGPVVLYPVVEGNGQPQQGPLVRIGQAGLPNTLPTVHRTFDFTHYGEPRPDPITQQSHFDVTDTIDLNSQMGSIDGRMGMVYTLNGKSFPDTPVISVHLGELVKFHIVNNSNESHPMHLHGHVFSVLTYNGRPVTGSPIYQDTVLVKPFETVDIAFLANNPGLWMFHCHNLLHAYWGMDMMVVYPNISTPYNIGSQSGNYPD